MASEPLYQKRLILTTNTQATKIKSSKSRYLNPFFVIFLVVVVTHNTFKQLNIPTQDLPSWLV